MQLGDVCVEGFATVECGGVGIADGLGDEELINVGKTQGGVTLVEDGEDDAF